MKKKIVKIGINVIRVWTPLNLLLTIFVQVKFFKQMKFTSQPMHFKFIVVVEISKGSRKIYTNLFDGYQ